jgi:hypothetical protein
VHERHVIRWPIPPLHVEAANEVLEQLADSAQIIIDGYTNSWDGNSWRGRYTECACDEMWDIGERLGNGSATFARLYNHDDVEEEEEEDSDES